MEGERDGMDGNDGWESEKDGRECDGSDWMKWKRMGGNGMNIIEWKGKGGEGMGRMEEREEKRWWMMYFGLG